MADSPIVVLPATGKVGREVVASLLARGARVRAVSRATAHFEDVPSLEAVFRGAPRVFFVTPYSEIEERLGENVVEAARRAGVEKLCYVGAAHPDTDAAWLRAMILWGVGIVGPHYKPKFRVEEATWASSWKSGARKSADASDRGRSTRVSQPRTDAY